MAIDVQSSLVAALMFGGGAGCVGVGIWRGFRTRLAQRWPQVRGEIIVARVAEYAGRNGYTYEPSVRYRYEVNGRIYDSDRIRFASTLDLPNSHSSAERVLQSYQRGSQVPVHYNPADPSDAVLYVEQSSDAPLFAVGGLLLFVLGLFVRWATRT
jgi:hypothetical protein